MDLSSLLGNLEATTTDTTPALSEPVSLLGGLDTYNFFPPAPLASEMTLPKPEEPKVKPVSFLERLLRQQTNLMGQKTKIESSESLWKWLCEQKDQPEGAASKESSQLLPSLQEQLVSPQSEKAAEGAEASSAPIILHSDLSADEDEGSDVDLDVLLDSDKVELVQTTPGVIDDVESPLSSAVSSPSASTTNQGAECGSTSSSTADLHRMLSDQHTSPGTSTSRSSSVSKRRKSRSRRQTQSVDNLPSEQDLEWMNKTDRKKFQNKIAAIRYRMKKKAESSQKKSEVDELEGINKKLQQQVEKLSKEVTYMKNFFNDVRKARGLPTIKF